MKNLNHHPPSCRGGENDETAGQWNRRLMALVGAISDLKHVNANLV
tara:strand:- start:344 stop:481 length:138 start_codon:yes stop_codon:yes gene_type:complete